MMFLVSIFCLFLLFTTFPGLILHDSVEEKFRNFIKNHERTYKPNSHEYTYRFAVFKVSDNVVL